MQEKEIIKFYINNKLEDITKVTDMIVKLIENEQINFGVGHDLLLIFDELLSNIIHYGYENNKANHSIIIKMRLANNGFAIEISDDGKYFDPTRFQPNNYMNSINNSKAGGLGIYLVKKKVDKISYEYKNGRNVLYLQKGGINF